MKHTVYLFLVLTLALAFLLGCDADILGFGDRPGGGYDIPTTLINYVINPPDNAPLDVGSMAALSFVDKSYADDQGRGILNIVDGDDYQILICLYGYSSIMIAYAESAPLEVEFSAASTADALIMMHPLLIEIPYSEKTILLDNARLHKNYQQLVSDIEALLVSDPYNALNPDIYPNIFETAVGIFEDVYVTRYSDLSSNLGTLSSLSSNSTSRSMFSLLPSSPGAGEGDVELTQDNPGSGIIEFNNWKAIHYMATTDGTKDVGGDLYEYTWVGSKGIMDIVLDRPKNTEYRLPDGRYQITVERGKLSEYQQWSEAAGKAGTANLAKGVLHLITVVAGLPGEIPEKYQYAVALADILKDIWLLRDAAMDTTPDKLFLEILKYVGKHTDDIIHFFGEGFGYVIKDYFSFLYYMLADIFKIAGYADALAYAWDMFTANVVTYDVEMIDGVLYFPDDGDAPPDTPQLIYPENGQTDVEPRPTFRWTETMSSGWAPFEQVSQSASATNATGANRLTGTAAVACQASNAQAQLNHIRQSAEGYNPLSPAESYRIQVDDNSDFSSPEIDRSGITDNQFKPSSDLGENKTYYWRVRAHNQWGDSSWSTVWTFTVGDENHPPYDPECVHPTDGATDVSVNTYLEWSCYDPDDDPLTYEVYICPEGGEEWILIDDEYIDGTQCDLPFTLDYETWYYWYVVATDPDGLTSEPDDDWMFQTEPESGTPPSTPLPIYPDNGDTGVPVRPTFRWNATRTAGGAMHGLSPTSSTFGRLSPAEDYHIQVDTESGFSYPRIIDVEYISTTQYRPDSDLDYGTYYYWRVRARNESGYSAWSDAVYGDYLFKTREQSINTPPDPPSNPSPADGATGVDIDANLSWYCEDDDDDTLQFLVYWGLYGNPIYRTTLTEVYTWDPGTMDYSTDYEWYIVADDGQDTTEGPHWTYTTGNEPNNPPNPPSNPVPANGAGDVPITTNLQWQCSDPDDDALNYDVYFGTTTTPPLVADHITTKNWDPPGNLDYSQLYYWYIVARDTHEATTEGPLWNFTTIMEPANQPPGPFDLQHPKDTSSGVDMSLHPMQWEASVDPDDDTVTYTVYWGTSPGSYPNSHDCGTSTSYAPSLNYSGTKYYWMVIADDGHGGTRDSDEWEFTTHNSSAPGQVTLVSPTNGATGISRYPFHNWSDKPYCWYYIQVSLYSDFHLMDYCYATSYDSPEKFGGPAGSQYDNDWYPLDPYTKYYWRVRTLNDYALGPWSAVFDFTTGS